MIKSIPSYSDYIEKKNNSVSNKPISFTGHKIVEDDKGEKKYRIFLPAMDTSKNNTVEVEFVQLAKDNNGNIITDSAKIIKNKKINQSENYIDISPKSMGITPQKNSKYEPVLGYQIKINRIKYLDNTLRIKTSLGQFNVLSDMDRPVMSSARTMYHIMPSCFNPKLEEKKITDINGNKVTVDISKVRTNHFNDYEAKITDMTNKISELKASGFKRVITTPIFGQDNISTHGYWTTNPYQVTSKLGNEKDFDKFQLELFKNGMGHVADGAFVNEALEGIHLKDILKHGKDSPFVDHLELHNFPDQPLKLGVLPLNEEAYKNADVKIINDPVKENYKKNEPTYVQIYDKRLVSKEQATGETIIRSYARKNLNDPNEIKTYMDSVQPYHFEVQPEDVIKKHEEFKKSGSGEFKNVLLNWPNFSLVKSDEDGGMTLWAGNKDIAKLRFMITKEKEDEIRKSYHNQADADKRIEQLHVAIAQVQDNIVQVGGYWTDKTAKLLTTHVAQSLAGAKDAKEFKTKITEAIISENVPDTAKSLTDDKNNSIENILDGNYKHNFAQGPSSVSNGLMKMPLETIEFSPDLTSVLATPFIKKLASSKEDIGVSREDQDIESVPERFREIYQTMTDVYKNEMTDKATAVLSAIDEQGVGDTRLLNGNKELESENAGIYRLIADDITKFLVVKALKPEITVADYNNPDKLNKINCKNLGLNQSTPETAAKQLVGQIKSGLLNISQDDIEEFAKTIAPKIKGVDAKAVLVSQLLLDKTESGLEWRIDAAKDVSDIEALDSKKANTDELWNSTIDFWSKFNKEVNKYNQRAYKIGELTNAVTNGTSRFKNDGEVEKKFVTEGGFVTPTNYKYLYGTLHKLFGGFPEYGGMDGGRHMGVDDLHEKLLWGWCGGQPNESPGFLFSGPQDTVLYSHVASGNHDKPRTLHGFALNAGLMYTGEIDKNTAKELFDSLGKYSELAPIIKDINSALNPPILDKKNIVDVKNVTDKYGVMPMVEFFDKVLKNEDWYTKKDLVEKVDWIKNNRLSANETDKLKVQKEEWFYSQIKDNIDDYFNIIEQIENKNNKENIKEIFTSANDEIKDKLGIVNVNPEEKRKELLKIIPQESLAMASAMMDGFLKASDALKAPDALKNEKKLEITEEYKKSFAQVVDKLAMGKNAEYFAIRSFEHNWIDIIKEASKDSESFKAYFNENGKEIEAKAHEYYIKPAMDRYKELMKVVVALPGNPTNYAGEELGETGAETKAKNVYRQNRNRLHHEWVKKTVDEKGNVKPGADYREYVATYKEDIAKITKLRNEEALSPLVNGNTVMLKNQKAIDELQTVVGLYRYNDNTDVITLIHNSGFDATRNGSKAEAVELDKIDLGSTEIESKKDNDENPKYQVGLPFKLATGSVFVNALDKNDINEYKIDADGNLVNANKAEKIKIVGSTLILKRKANFKGVTFTGSKQNSNVALANLKFNLPVSNNQSAQKTKVAEKPNKIFTSV
jgi:glycosidase